jgi:NADPH:quinone reductase-like Zn-dependent oxidoreductase
MRAYHVTPGGGIEGIVPVELPDPVPSPGELLIRMRATSLNYRDLLITKRTQQPLIPLSDGAGEVIGVGDGVTGFAVGDRVAGCFFLHWRLADGGCGRSPSAPRSAAAVWTACSPSRSAPP